MVLRHWLWLNLLILVTPYIYSEQPSISMEQLINSLIKLDSQEEQAALLLQNKELLTNELIDELDKKANTLKLKSEYPEALKTYNLLQ